MRTIAGVVLWIACWAGTGVVVRAVANAITGTRESLWWGAAMGGALGLGTLLILAVSKKEWIRGLLRDPKRVRELNGRRARLRREREEIIARARRG